MAGRRTWLARDEGIGSIEHRRVRGSGTCAIRGRSSIERAVLGYILAAVALLTLSPFRFAWPSRWIVAYGSDWQDMPANVLLFLPVGYFFLLSLPERGPRAILNTLWFGVVTSTFIEAVQLFLPDRLTSLTDVLGNALGAVSGAVLCNAIRRRLDRRLPTVLTLEHPLLNVVYLILPLMWLSGFEVGPASTRVWLIVPLGAAGALTLIGLWRHRFAAAVDLPRPVVAGAVAVWFLIGAMTDLAIAPLVVAQCAAGVFAFTLVLVYVGGTAGAPRERFEHKVLAPVWPCYLFYLLMLVLLSHPLRLTSFHVELGFPAHGFDRRVAVRFAEQIAALTLLGYLVAEWFGRSTLPRAGLRARNVSIGAAGGLVLEICHGFLPGDRASVTRWALSTLGAGFGVLLYSLQLNVVQVLRGATVLTREHDVGR